MMKNVKDGGIGVSYPDVQSTGSSNAIVNLEKGDVILLRHMVMNLHTIFHFCFCSNDVYPRTFLRKR